MVPAGTMHAHTASAAVGVVVVESECVNCMLRRMESEVVRGAEVPNPPHERGGACRMHASEAEWEAFRRSTAAAVMNDWGEPVSSRATRPQRLVAVGPLCTRTFVVNDESSTVRTPPMRQGPCSGIGRWEAVRQVDAAAETAETEGNWLTGGGSGVKGGRGRPSGEVGVGAGWVGALVS